MKLYRLLFFLLICTAQVSNAQVILLTELFKNDGRQVDSADSADYVRIVDAPDSAAKTVIIREFYADGSRKSIANATSWMPIQYEGAYHSFHPNGKRKEISSYHKGDLIDTTYNFYPNGQLYTAKYEIPSVKDAIDQGQPQRSFYIKLMKNANGKDMVVDGNGDAIIYNDDFQSIIESGKLKNGVREGIWTGKHERLTLTYIENYKNGKLISGESTDLDGTVRRYTQDLLHAKFKGGMERFYKYVSQNLRYPPLAAGRNIQGKVFVKFTVLEDGTVSDIRSVYSPNKTLTYEALRVIEYSPKWEPGLWKGKKIKEVYNIPISFTLTNPANAAYRN